MELVMIVEDDPDISELIQFNLEKSGFKTLICEDGDIALKQLETIKPHLILLDHMLPSISGFKLCKIIKENKKTTEIPVIIISAKSEESDVVFGLEVGADDYVRKPFSPNELVARCQSVLRRSGFGATSGTLEVPRIRMDLAQHETFHNEVKLKLTLAEFNLLKTLISHPGKVFSRELLLEKITGGGTFLIDRNIDVHVRSIRKKLNEDANRIETVRGVGYKWRN